MRRRLVLTCWCCVSRLRKGHPKIPSSLRHSVSLVVTETGKSSLDSAEKLWAKDVLCTLNKSGGTLLNLAVQLESVCVILKGREQRISEAVLWQIVVQGLIETHCLHNRNPLHHLHPLLSTTLLSIPGPRWNTETWSWNVRKLLKLLIHPLIPHVMLNPSWWEWSSLRVLAEDSYT